MKRLMLSGTLQLIYMAVTFYLASGNTPQINRSDLLLWRITLYGVVCGLWFVVCAEVCMSVYRHIVRQSAVSH